MAMCFPMAFAVVLTMPCSGLGLRFIARLPILGHFRATSWRGALCFGFCLGTSLARAAGLAFGFGIAMTRTTMPLLHLGFVFLRDVRRCLSASGTQDAHERKEGEKLLHVFGSLLLLVRNKYRAKERILTATKPSIPGNSSTT